MNSYVWHEYASQLLSHLDSDEYVSVLHLTLDSRRLALSYILNHTTLTMNMSAFGA